VSVTARHLVGREDELGAIVRLLDDAERLPGAAVLHGEAGIGKTALWLAAVEAAEARGYRVLATRPTEAETGYSLAGLTDLLGDVVDGFLPQLPPIQRQALEVALLLSEPGARADERTVAAAFLGALRLLAAERPLCLAVDDVQWLDAASLAPLRFALPRLSHEPVAAFVTVRGSVPPWLRGALPEERLQTIEVAGLSVGAIHELLRARLDAAFPRPTLIRIWETSAGNPFFALELGRALQRRGGTLAPGEALPIPTDLSDLLRERLDGLSADAVAVARAVAALAGPTVTLVEAAVGAGFERGLSEGLDARVLELDRESVRFTHPLLGSAVATREPPSRRRSLHARLAKLVGTAEERARHAAFGTDDPDHDVAALLEDAARAAHARGAPATAAELAERAAVLTPAAGIEDGRRRLLLAADRYVEAGDPGRATELLEPVLAAAPAGRARATVLVQLAKIRGAAAGAPQEAIALCHEALAEVPEDDALVASIHLNLGSMYGVTDKDRALGHAELAVRRAARVTDAALRCRALASYASLRFGLGRGAPAAELEEALVLERSLPEWPLSDGATATLAFVLVWSGELARARPILHELRDALRSRGDPKESGALWLLTVLEWRAGNWELAARYAAEEAAVRDQGGLEGGWPAKELAGALVAAHRGRIQEARATSERALAGAEATGFRIGQSGHRSVLGFIELSLGNAAAALAYLRPAWRIRDEVRLLEPGHRLELADTLEALIAVGELDEAEALLVPWEERSQTLDRAWALAILARCRGLLLAARGDHDGAFASFDRGLAEHDRDEDPFSRARTLLALGRTQRRAKRRGAARATLEDALARFERVGAPLWAEQARAELARIGGRTASGDELTEAERRIAGLVAEGRTNREVADALFLTVHSVETALTRIYRKLGVRSRAELAHLLSAKS